MSTLIAEAQPVAGISGTEWQPVVGICLQNVNVSGAEKQFIRLAQRMVQAGAPLYLMLNEALRAEAASQGEMGRILSFLEEKGRLLVVPPPPRFMKGLLQEVWRNVHVLRLARRHGLELIHAVLFGFPSSRLAMLTGIPVILEVSSPDHADIMIRLQRHRPTLLSKVRLFSACSPSVMKRLRRGLEEGGSAELAARIECIPFPFFVPNEQSNGVARENLVTYASRFIDRKNPILFAEAAKEFLKLRPDWRVAVLGFGPLKEQIESLLAEEIRKGQAVVEHARDVNAYFRRSKFYVSLIHPDNYPSQSILEAMHMGNPIIATDAGDTNVFVTPENGLLVGYDKAQVLEAMLRLSGDERLRSAMGEASRRRVSETFSPDLYVDQLRKLYATMFEIR